MFPTLFHLRTLRWLVLAALLPALWACNPRKLSAPGPGVHMAVEDAFLENPQLKLDIVFVIDNSPSMREEQTNLIRNFPRFMNVLAGAHPSGTPDVHIGVISTNLGSGAEAAQGCAGDGDGGRFQNAPRAQGGTCTSVPSAPYIIAGPAGNNFPGTTADVFSCVAELGITGCGFEHPLAALRRALGGDPSVGLPAGHDGFLRPDAVLGIVLITDEDDCSAPPDTDLFTQTSTRLADPYGPIDSFRCNEFGHLCAGAPPPRAPTAGLTDCHSNETDSSKLIKVGEVVTFLRSLKDAPDRIKVAAITGIPTSYSVVESPEVDTRTGERHITVAPACQSSAGLAAPSVRIKDFIDAFGGHGLIETICADDFGPAMEHIARQIIGDPLACVQGRLYDVDPAREGLQADCAVYQSARNDAGEVREDVIPACEANGGTPPCWQLTRNEAQCATAPQQMQLEVERGGAPAPANTRVDLACAVCAGPADPRCP
jgi:hypothetical protein